MENLELLIRKVLEERSLRDWVKEKWVRIDSDGDIAGACGTSKNKQRPDRCLPQAKAQSLSKSERAATAQKKKKTSAQVVANTKKARVTEILQILESDYTPINKELWSRATAAARAKFDTYPSAYANLWASKWYKKRGGSWKKKKKKKK
jgi:hypothetical protein